MISQVKHGLSGSIAKFLPGVAKGGCLGIFWNKSGNSVWDKLIRTIFCLVTAASKVNYRGYVTC